MRFPQKFLLSDIPFNGSVRLDCQIEMYAQQKKEKTLTSTPGLGHIRYHKFSDSTKILKDLRR